MSDDVSISYSYSTNTSVNTGTTPQGGQARSDDTEQPFVAFADCDLIPVNSELTLVINRQNGKQQLVSRQVVDALMTCTEFDTIDNHTRKLCNSRPELRNQEAVVAKTLQQLFEHDLLFSAGTICRRLNMAPKRSLPSAGVFVITCDRPEAVERLLDSLLRAGGLSRYDPLVLIDDSRDADNMSANRSLVEKFNITSAKSMSYFGAMEQAALTEHLIGSLPEHENAIRFLIDQERWTGHATYGRSRTLALLLSVGRRAIILDDDILCQAMRPVIQKKGVFVGSNGKREAAFFPDRDTLMSVAVPANESPLDTHARYLGAPIGSAILGLNEGDLTPAQLRGANAAMTNVWDADSPVLVTQCGSWGDPGVGDPHWVVNLDRESVERMLALPTGMANAIESRCVWFGVIQPTIMKTAFMSQMTGLDNSALLPPYFPIFRGEDLLFASMVEAMHPKAAVVECDFSVPHLPEERERRGIKSPIAQAGGVPLFANYLTSKIDYTDRNDPSHRMAILAQDFRRLADKSTVDLLLDYRKELAKAHAMQLMAINGQRARDRDSGSPNWEGYLQRAQEEMQGALERVWSPTELDGVDGDMTEEGLIDGFRELLRGYADALDAWEAIRACAAS